MSDNNFDSGSMDLEKLLEKKELLEGMIRDKFTKFVSVMFTDLKGSTSLAEREGDLSTRAMIRDHNNIVFPAIQKNNGILVKSMGDGTLSYFDDTQGAVRAAVEIQKGFKQYNIQKGRKEPILIRVGIHTGNAIIEKTDIFGDVVNTASRFESSSNPSEISISEDTYNALSDKDEIPCRYIKDINLKGKAEPFKCYKAYWDPSDLEKDMAAAAEEATMAPDDASNAIDEGTIMVDTKAAYSGQTTIESQTPMPSTAPIPGPSESMLADDARIVQHADMLKSTNELLQMFLFCEENSSFAPIKQMHQQLISELQMSVKRETLFFGDQALWIYKNIMTTGRLQNADFPITNLAISRAPVSLGVRNGEGFLIVQTPGGEKVNLIEIESGGTKTTVEPNKEYPLGKNGKIIFSVCFPFEYSIYHNRFLTLRLFALEQCVQEAMNMSLAQVWKNHSIESSRLIIVGA